MIIRNGNCDKHYGVDLLVSKESRFPTRLLNKFLNLYITFLDQNSYLDEARDNGAILCSLIYAPSLQRPTNLKDTAIRESYLISGS